jgi:hypothetical protein
MNQSAGLVVYCCGSRGQRETDVVCSDTDTQKKGKGNVGESEKSFYCEIQDTQGVSVHQPSAFSDLLGDSTSMDVDITSVDVDVDICIHGCTATYVTSLRGHSIHSFTTSTKYSWWVYFSKRFCLFTSIFFAGFSLFLSI